MTGGGLELIEKRKKVFKVPASVIKRDTKDILEQARLLHQSIANRMAGAGFTQKEIEEAVKKAKYDVRRARRTNGN